MWTVLPAKNFANAKQRLGGLLSPQERRDLFRAMLEDVLEVLSTHPLIEGVVLVSDDPTARMLAQQYQVEFLDESTLGARGLNEVIQATVGELAKRDIHEVMVIHGDLPLISAAELTRLITIHRTATVPALTIAPDRHSDGSNCVLCTPATAIAFSYGQSSLRKHVEQAARIGAKAQLVSLPGAGFDVDWPDDVLELLNRKPLLEGKRTVSYLKDHDIMSRVACV